MGKQKVEDKIIGPQEVVRALQSGSITTLQAQQMFNGVMPIGDYKGVAAIFDLDKLVNQPLVNAEWQHILGILDGREEDYDLQTLGIVLNEAAGTAHMAQLTVPAGEVWFISTVELAHPLHAGANAVGVNWYCDLWTDRIGALGYGQPFHPAMVGGGVADIGAAMLQQDDFWYTAPIVGVGNKASMLRAPAGTIFTVVFTNMLAVAGAAINCTFALRGFIGKVLVA